MYMRKDLENDLEEHIANVAKELDELSNSANDGTPEDAGWRADRRQELQERQRELVEALADSKAKHGDGGYREALQRQVRKMHTPADAKRVELDRKVREHAERTGDTYVDVAKKLRERGELDA